MSIIASLLIAYPSIGAAIWRAAWLGGHSHDMSARIGIVWPLSVVAIIVDRLRK